MLGGRWLTRIPATGGETWELFGIQRGDLIEVSANRDGTALLERKILLDRDPELERDLAAAAEDVKAGRIAGPFETARDAMRNLNATKRRRRAHARHPH